MKKYGIGLLSIAILIASFLICRFALFDMHKMKQFPLVLLIAGERAAGAYVPWLHAFRVQPLPAFRIPWLPRFICRRVDFSPRLRRPYGRNDPEQYVDNMHNSILGYRVHRHRR